jgi:hypothetical protein
MKHPRGDNSLKDVKGKIPYRFVPPHSLEEVALGFAEGAAKYEPWDWLEMDPEFLIEAAIRHLNAIRKGEAIDPDSGLQHANKAATSCMMVAEILRLEQGGEPVRAVGLKDPLSKTTFEVAEAVIRPFDEVRFVTGGEVKNARHDQETL